MNHMKMNRSISIIASTVSALLVSASALAADARAYAASKFSLELDGAPVGWLSSVEGGGASAEITDVAFGSVVNKHVALPKYDDFIIETGPGGSTPLQEWLEGFVGGLAPRKDGSIVVADFNLRERQRADFGEALITELSFPSLDAASKDPGLITVKITPYISRFKKGSGATVKAPTKAQQKLWLPSNFRLDIPGLECKRVSKIDAFTIKQSLHDVGDVRDYLKEPGKIEYPNLKLRIPQIDLDSWLAWYESFLVNGESTDQNEKSGTLTLLGANLQSEVGRIELKNIGLARLTPFVGKDQSDAVAYFEVELYVESMTLDLK